MCGLIAAYDPNSLEGLPFEEALNKIIHRGPDAKGILWRNQGHIYLAHARLKIIDTTNDANQPFLSPCGRWALVYNGEIYNFRELRIEIGDCWQWRTQSDTEVLMAAWTIWGSDCLKRLVGMFAFVIHDKQKQTITAVRDRFGVKPLYYLNDGERWIFASEIPPLLLFQKNIKEDKATIRTYLELGLYDHSNHTFFAGINSMIPGELIEIDLCNDTVNTVNWYSLIDNIQNLSNWSVEDITNECERLILQAITAHLVADVEVGLNVSGGVDSAMLIRTSIEKLGHAHLFTQDYAGYSELPWINKISKGGSLIISELDLDKISSYLDQTILSQAEPFGGVFVCGYNALYEMACKEEVTVLLDGNGVDESFLGYKRYHQIHALSKIKCSDYPLSKVEEFEEFWGHKPKVAIKGASIDGTNGLQPEVITKELKQHELLRTPSLEGFSNPVRRAAAEDLLYTKIPRGLRFNDRVSMSHSRELRVPYLDHRLVEFAFSIPVDLLLNKNGGKALFRDVLSRYAPKSIAYAKKRSVQSPQREWLAGGWRTMVESILNSKSFCERGWVDPDAAKFAYKEYLNGNQENSFFIWQWVNLELWARAFLDNKNIL